MAQPKRKPVLLWLDAGDLAAMREVRTRTGIPVVQQVRRAVALTLNENARAAEAFAQPTRRRATHPARPARARRARHA